MSNRYNNLHQKKLEQERRDLEIALRLDYEINGQIKGSPSQIQSGHAVVNDDHTLNKYTNSHTHLSTEAYTPTAPPESTLPFVQHRYFRIPFMNPNEKEIYNKERGWWYAHFDGEFLVREMELQPNMPPVLLTAGVDDICKITLEDSGLTNKRNAEIRDIEFECVWNGNGGKTYFVPSDRNKHN